MKNPFNLNRDDDEIATPVKTEQEIKQSEVRKMSGFDNISDVAKAAPSASDYENKDAQPRQRSSQSSQPSKRAVTRKDKEDEAAREKAERKKRALETIGKRYCKILAEVPYDMWAKFADDGFLALTPEEAKELTDSYFELAQALEPDLTSPWVIAGGIAVQNLLLIGVRIKHLAELEEEEKKELEEVKEVIKEHDSTTKFN